MSYFGDCVDIESGTDFCDDLIGNKQNRDATSNKNHVVETRPQ
jgi:hypothetical protein